MSRVLMDPEAKVRVAACALFEQMDYEIASHHVSRKVLCELAERCKDLKVRPLIALFLLPFPLLARG